MTKTNIVSLDGIKFDNKEGFKEFLKLINKEDVEIAKEFEQSTEDAYKIRDKELAALN